MALIFGFTATAGLSGCYYMLTEKDPGKASAREGVLWLLLWATISVVVIAPDAHQVAEDNIAEQRTLEIVTK